ncbi:MAG: ABC transporter permease [Vicinamibacterales bacterium]
MPHPETLVEVQVDAHDTGRTGRFIGRRSMITYPVWNLLRERQESFDGLSAWGTTQLDLSTGGESRPAEAIWVSGTFFLLGVTPAAGRLLGEVDDQHACASPGVVVSHRFAQREFGGASEAIGRTLRLDGHPLDVVGVSAASFYGVEVGRSFDVAVPICAQPLLRPEQNAVDSRYTWWLGLLGRLRPGVTVEQANAELEAARRADLRRDRPAIADAG